MPGANITINLPNKPDKFGIKFWLASDAKEQIPSITEGGHRGDFSLQKSDTISFLKKVECLRDFLHVKNPRYKGRNKEE